MSEAKEIRSAAEVMADGPIDCVNILYSILAMMPAEYVLPTICTSLDQWFADNDFTEEQALESYERMAKAARDCYAAMGMSKKSSEMEEE